MVEGRNKGLYYSTELVINIEKIDPKNELKVQHIRSRNGLRP